MSWNNTLEFNIFVLGKEFGTFWYKWVQDVIFNHIGSTKNNSSPYQWQFFEQDVKQYETDHSMMLAQFDNSDAMFDQNVERKL